MDEKEKELRAEYAAWARDASPGDRLTIVTGMEDCLVRSQIRAAARWICAAGLARHHHLPKEHEILLRTREPWHPDIIVQMCKRCERPNAPHKLFCHTKCNRILGGEAVRLGDMLQEA